MMTTNRNIEKITLLKSFNSLGFRMVCLKLRILNALRRMVSDSRENVLQNIKTVINEAPPEVRNMPAEPGELTPEQMVGKWESLTKEYL
jgi:hypothetical protein